ncbi:MAG: molecular chaperone DnaJ [Geobacteraceae bacterium GWB2_52_12]|nr:MAG: molecular chaperone DnaJ [Geobacteraceae bacterium GWB2_52_12]
MTYAELKTALCTFNFSERDRLTLAQVKRRHRDLIKLHHPDARGVETSIEMQQVNDAAAVLMTYLNSYSFSFTEEEFYQQNPDERLRMQFSNDPVWGGS